MRVVCVILVFSCGWATAAPIPKSLRAAGPDDRAKLIGNWSLVTISTETGPANMDQGLELKVTDESSKAVYAVGGISETLCTITLKSNDSPRSWDWRFDDSGSSILYKCVYELSENKLKIVRPVNDTDPRPTSCEAEQKGCVMYEFERVK